MSHFNKIKSSIKDLEALRAATSKMGFDLIKDGACRYYYGTEKADMVIKLPGKYDIALEKSDDHYEMKADLYKGHVEKYVGPDAGLLKQQYSVEKARIEAYKTNLAVTETVEGQDIILTLTDPDTGGQIITVCHVGGKIDIRTTGFPGSACMKFKDFESALGTTEEFGYTPEYYEAETVTENEEVRNIWDL